jgi:hypothetical protein
VEGSGMGALFLPFYFLKRAIVGSEASLGIVVGNTAVAKNLFRVAAGLGNRYRKLCCVSDWYFSQKTGKILSVSFF